MKSETFIDITTKYKGDFWGLEWSQYYFIIKGIVYYYRRGIFTGKVKKRVVYKIKQKFKTSEIYPQTVEQDFKHLLSKVKEFYDQSVETKELNFFDRFKVVVEKCTKTITVKKKQ